MDSSKKCQSVPKRARQDGNTKKIHPAKYWCFTLNNYTESQIQTICAKCARYCEKWVFQEETGKNGTPHLQGSIQFRKKTRPKSKFGINEIHWEKTRNIDSAFEYCYKEETRSGRVWYDGIEMPPRDPLEGKELYPWQADIIDLCCTEPDDRTINWFWEKDGNIGKTALTKHICIKYNAIMVTGKANDVKCAIATMKPKPKIVIWDMVRCLEEYVSYQALEEVKNGIFFNGKYESGMVMYDPPHVIVFANFEPNTDKLSLDRWNIQEL